MRDFLHPLAAMQIDALKIARLLYKVSTLFIFSLFLTIRYN